MLRHIFCGRNYDGNFTYRIRISTCAMFLGRRFKEYQMLSPGCARIICQQDWIKRSIRSGQ